MEKALRFMIVMVASVRRASLEGCLRSLEQQTRLADEMILVDAASHEGIMEWVQHNHPRVSLLRLFQVPYMAHAWKKGVQSALQRVPEHERLHTWVVCARTDLVFDERALEVLETEIRGSASSLILGPTVFKSYHRHTEDLEEYEAEKTEHVLSRGLSLTRGCVLQTQKEAGAWLTPPGECMAFRADILHRALEQKAFTVPFLSLEALLLDACIRVHAPEESVQTLEAMHVWREEGKASFLEEAEWFERVYAHGWFGIKTLPWRFVRRVKALIAPRRTATFSCETHEASWLWERLHE